MSRRPVRTALAQRPPARVGRHGPDRQPVSPVVHIPHTPGSIRQAFVFIGVPGPDITRRSENPCRTGKTPLLPPPPRRRAPGQGRDGRFASGGRVTAGAAVLPLPDPPRAGRPGDAGRRGAEGGAVKRRPAAARGQRGRGALNRASRDRSAARPYHDLDSEVDRARRPPQPRPTNSGFELTVIWRHGSRS